jgi:uncharacterized protein
LIRRLRVAWPSTLPKAATEARPVRLLAVSDQTEHSLEIEPNRSALEPLDAVLAAGDLEPDYLSYLGDAFRVPLLYVRGNHDRGGGWRHGRHLLPQPLDGKLERVSGIAVAGMSWPSPNHDDHARRDEFGAWRQAIGLFRRARVPGPVPRIIVSHVPPRGLGDAPADAYHAGFAGYRWLCRTLRPVLWLHGHTTLASAPDWRCTWQRTTLVNVTGAVFIEIEPAPLSLEQGEHRGG